MREICVTRNVSALIAAYQRIEERSQPEGMALVYGAPGLGKTTACCSLFVKKQGILLTARPGWTMKALLRSLLFELGIERQGSNADLLDEAIRVLGELNRPVFVDEADFLFYDGRTLETLRALHDVSGVPVILIGMNSVAGKPGIDQRIKRLPQLHDRLMEVVEFFPADLKDVTLMARKYCAASLDEALLQQLLSDTKGNFRRIRLKLAQMQNFAKRKQADVLSLEAWREYAATLEQRANQLRG